MILLLKGLIWFGISNFQEFLKEVRFLVSIKVSLTLKKEKSISKGQNNRKELESFIILCLIIWLLKLFQIKNESVMKDFFTFLVFYIFPDKRTQIRTRNGRHLQLKRDHFQGSLLKNGTWEEKESSNQKTLIIKSFRLNYGKHHTDSIKSFWQFQTL